MKNIHLTFLVIGILGWSCQPEASSSSSKDEIVFIGKIGNAVEDQLTLTTSLLTEKAEVQDGQFLSSMDSDEPLIVNFSFGQNKWTAFGKPGDTIRVEFDSKNFTETIAFSGPYAEENRLKLATDKIIEDSLGTIQTLFTLPESAFLSKLDNINNTLRSAVDAFRKEHPDADSDFLQLIEEDVRYAVAAPLFKYENLHKLFSQDSTYQASETLTAAKAKVKVENPALLNLPRYTSFINDVNFMTIYKILEENEDLLNENKALLIATTQAVEETFQDPEVKDYLLFDALKKDMEWTGPEDAGDFYTSFMEESKNEFYKGKLKEIEVKWDHLKAGMDAPDFSYPDVDSVYHTLSDYKGKYVFIDVWATWCGPCLAQQPEIEALEEQYKDNPNIVFMAVSIDADADAWRRMVTQKNMKGVQILAEAAFNSEINKAYNIGTIPRYIMVDTKGKLIDASAPRPTTDDLKTLFKGLLQPEPISGD